MKQTNQNLANALPVPASGNSLNPFLQQMGNAFKRFGAWSFAFGLAALFAFTPVSSTADLQSNFPKQSGTTENKPDCQLPAPTSFSAERTGTSTAALEWSAVQGAVSYNLIVYNLSTYEVVYNSVGSSTSATVSGLQSGANYRCTVAAMCSAGSTSSFIIWEDILD